MKDKVLVTSALPYANGPLHFGHIAGAYLPADVHVRFQRLKGKKVLFICGSDEYGVAITLSARLAKRSPKDHVDQYHGIIKNFFNELNISFDHYSRTTWPGHIETTQEFFRDLLKNNYIEEKVCPQLYSENENMFLADRYVIGSCPKCGFEKARGDECQSCGASYEATELKNPRSKISGAPLVLRPTKHWFLLFDKFKDQLKSWIEKKNWKPNVVKFAKGYIDELRPRAITRDSEWGITVPLEEAKGKVFYVWFDAPIGYISATRDWASQTGNPEAWKDYWLDPDTKYIQFIGKDNIPFHAVFFPAMEMGQNQPYKIVDDLPANEFLNLEGRAFSKSDGWYIDLERFFENFTTDQARYALAANAPETQDSEFTWKDFQMRCNSELLGKYGNLANRALVFIANNLNAQIPPLHDLNSDDKKFLSEIDQLIDDIADAYENYHVRKACQLIMHLAQLGNTYFNDQAPWKLKDPSEKSRLETVIHLCLHCLKALAFTSFPVIPDTAEKLWHLLGNENSLTTLSWDDLKNLKLAPKPLPKPEVLFKRVEDKIITQELAELDKLRVKQDTMENSSPVKDEITIDDVDKLDLRVGRIVTAERVPKSSKLLKLSVDIGTETRTVVSGIAQSYEEPSELHGRKIILIANLKPTKIMGIESEGMILAASLGKKCELPFLDQAAPGASVS